MSKDLGKKAAAVFSLPGRRSIISSKGDTALPNWIETMILILAALVVVAAIMGFALGC